MASKAPWREHPAWYRFRIGDWNAAIISDGELTFGNTADEFPNAPPEQVHEIAQSEFIQENPLVLQENCLLVDTGDRLVLFDTGFGDVPMFGEDPGQFEGNLAALGVKPDDIDTIVLTHCHPDHAWGLTDRHGNKRFANAELFLSQRDFDFWTDETKLGDPNAGAFVAGARKAILPYSDRLHLIGKDGEILPGVTSIASPGHTVGHTSFLLESGGESFLNLGDVCHHYALLFPNPRWEYLYDTDAGQAVETRLRIFDMATSEGLSLIGYHFPFPGVGNIRRTGPESYRYVPAHMSFV